MGYKYGLLTAVIIIIIAIWALSNLITSPSVSYLGVRMYIIKQINDDFFFFFFSKKPSFKCSLSLE